MTVSDTCQSRRGIVNDRCQPRGRLTAREARPIPNVVVVAELDHTTDRRAVFLGAIGGRLDRALTPDDARAIAAALAEAADTAESL